MKHLKDYIKFFPVNNYYFCHQEIKLSTAHLKKELVDGFKVRQMILTGLEIEVTPQPKRQDHKEITPLEVSNCFSFQNYLLVILIKTILLGIIPGDYYMYLEVSSDRYDVTGLDEYEETGMAYQIDIFFFINCSSNV